jgi:hypothetical protein
MRTTERPPERTTAPFGTPGYLLLGTPFMDRVLPPEQGPRYAEVPLSWTPDEAEAARSAREAFSFCLTGWKVQPELPNSVNFEAVTAFITEDDMRRKFGSGATLLATWPSPNDFVEAGYGHLALINGGPDPAGFLASFASELADPLRKLTPSP